MTHCFISGVFAVEGWAHGGGAKASFATSLFVASTGHEFSASASVYCPYTVTYGADAYVQMRAALAFGPNQELCLETNDEEMQDYVFRNPLDPTPPPLTVEAIGTVKEVKEDERWFKMEGRSYVMGEQRTYNLVVHVPINPRRVRFVFPSVNQAIYVHGEFAGRVGDTGPVYVFLREVTYLGRSGPTPAGSPEKRSSPGNTDLLGKRKRAGLQEERQRNQGGGSGSRGEGGGASGGASGGSSVTAG